MAPRQEHPAWVFNVLFDCIEKMRRLTAIDESVVIRDRDIHHLSQLVLLL